MRVSKARLVNGIADYVENEVIPQIEDKPTQIVISVAVKSILANPKLIDPIFNNSIFSSLLSKNKDGYELEGLFNAIEESVKQYGPFPIVIPPIPVISPIEKTLSFTDSDVQEIKRRIERSAMNA